ncbi:hypothetical protein CLV33_105235 [Jejuia pallidilutea]|uniref:Uncharacterized protein n=1 Tax=Jejuia pallidilutea TaxID=504487 RepID=A0A362X0X3_9FLAO|nr:hypothetical protein CLV33_105235 [Jejuia pallidilutea]
MVRTVASGEIVKKVTEKVVRKTYFPKKTKNIISHVKPYKKCSRCLYITCRRKLTGLTEYTKHCFWLYAS